MTDAQELKPCPFCGSDELSHGWSAPGCDGSMSTGNVECHNCNALIYSQQGECDAIAAWNTRASPVDANKPTPTAVADSAAADSVVNGGLVEAVAKELAREYLLVSDGHCRSVAKQILATAAPLIRAQIADNLDAMRRDETNWPQVIARLIREGKV